MKIVHIILSLIFQISVSHGFKVLGVLPIACKSHFAIGTSILKALHESGHNITVISPFSIGNETENYHEIDIQHILKKQNSRKVLFELIL